MPFKKVFRKARKAVKKIIPKEIRPALPYITAAYLGPAGGLGTLTGKQLALKAAIAGGTRFATDDEADLKDIARTSALAITPDVASKGLGNFARTYGRVEDAGETITGIQKLANLAGKGEAALVNAGNLKTIGAQTAVDAASQLAEIQQDEIDAYNRQLAEQGIRDKTQRRKAIRDIYLGIGYGEDYVDSMLDRFVYKGGGSTYTMDDILDMASEAAKKKRKEREEEDEDELSEYIDIGSRGLMSLAPKQKPMPIRPLQMAEGGMMDAIIDNMGEDFDYYTRLKIRELLKQGEDPEDVADLAEQEAAERIKRKYTGKAEGGMMNLGGNEMDLRGGGFVPIGKKEKADDVLARLSKNEFVMTADAVRGSGNGDINEGARRMYQTMDKLEAMA